MQPIEFKTVKQLADEQWQTIQNFHNLSKKGKMQKVKVQYTWKDWNNYKSTLLVPKGYRLMREIDD